MTNTFFSLELAYWQQTLIKLLAGVAGSSLLTGAVVYLYLFKFVSFMQSRLGPMEAGPYGSLQLLAEVGKWLQKEDIHTENSDRLIFGLAPAVVMGSTFLMFVVIPAGPERRHRRPADRHLLRAGDVVDLGDRHPDGGLGLGEQVRPARVASAPPAS